MGYRIGFSTRCRTIVWLSVAALLFQAAVLATHIPNIISAASATASNGSLQTFVICTPTGISLVTIDEDGQPVEDQPTSPAVMSCTLCANSVGLDGVLPVSLTLHQKPHVQVAPFIASVFVPRKKHVKGVSQKRAPPIIS